MLHIRPQCSGQMRGDPTRRAGSKYKARNLQIVYTRPESAVQLRSGRSGMPLAVLFPREWSRRRFGFACGTALPFFWDCVVADPPPTPGELTLRLSSHLRSSTLGVIVKASVYRSILAGMMLLSRSQVAKSPFSLSKTRGVNSISTLFTILVLGCRRRFLLVVLCTLYAVVSDKHHDSARAIANSRSIGALALHRAAAQFVKALEERAVSAHHCRTALK